MKVFIMKKFIKISVIGALITLILFSISACKQDPDEEEPGTVIMGETISISNFQVWEHNGNTNILSELFSMFTGNEIIYAVEMDAWAAFVLTGGADPDYINSTGSVNNGLLNITVKPPDPSYRYPPQIWLSIFPEYYNNNAEAILSDYFSADPYSAYANFLSKTHVSVYPWVNGNYITLTTVEPSKTDFRALDMEIYSGTDFSMSIEQIYFVYVESSCTMSGQAAYGFLQGKYFFTLDSFSIGLDKGWNALCKKTTFGKSGRASISVSKRSFDGLKWVLYQAVQYQITP